MPCFSPLTVIEAGSVVKGKLYNNAVRVGCGKCADCKHRRVNDWVFRLREEQKISSSSLFITLTYNNTHVPRTEKNLKTLHKRHYQLFMKLLRKKNTEKLVYYMCGEYGGQTSRPHYHAIIFNVKDKEDIQKSWKYGDVYIDEVNSNTIAYTCKYIDKEKQIPRFKGDDRVKEYSAMSNNIGKSYVTPKTIEYHNRSLDNNYIATQEGYKIALPRYYRKLLYCDSFIKQQTKHIQKLTEKSEKLNIEYYEKKGKHYEEIKRTRAVIRNNKIRRKNSSRNTV